MYHIWFLEGKDTLFSLWLLFSIILNHFIVFKFAFANSSWWALFVLQAYLFFGFHWRAPYLYTQINLFYVLRDAFTQVHNPWRQHQIFLSISAWKVSLLLSYVFCKDFNQFMACLWILFNHTDFLLLFIYS